MPWRDPGPAASALGSPSLADPPPAPAIAHVTHTTGRPSAPDFQFGARSPLDLGGTAPPPSMTAKVACPRCSTANEMGLRYCVTCGFAMETARTAPASPLAATYAASVDDADPPPSRGLTPTRVPEAGVIAPARVVSLSGPEAVADAVRVCARCRGACDASAQYCRFCGAPLADMPVVPSAAVPTPLRPPSIANASAGFPAAGPASAPTTDPIPPPPPRPPPRPPPAPVAAAEPSLAERIERAERAERAPVLRREVIVPRRSHDEAGAMSSTSQLHGFAPPAPEAREWVPKARVVVIARDGGEGPAYPIGEVLDIGRSEGQVTIGEDRYLSPRHARITRREGRLFLKDLGSTNGIYVRLRASRTDSSRPGPEESEGGDAPARRPGPGRAAGSAEHGGAPNASNVVAVAMLEGSTHLTTHPLKDQDLFLVGQQVLRFEVVNDALEGLGPAAQHGTLLFGTPASPRYARLSQRTVEGVTRDVFYIRKAETVLGRESGDIVFTEDPFLSRRHASIRAIEGQALEGRVLEGRASDVSGSAGISSSSGFVLSDLGSSNGTFIQIRGELALQSGDQFRIGQQLFRIDIA